MYFLEFKKRYFHDKIGTLLIPENMYFLSGINKVPILSFLE